VEGLEDRGGPRQTPQLPTLWGFSDWRGMPSKGLNRETLIFHIMNKHPRVNTSLNELFLLQKKLETGEINQGTWISYFSDLPADEVPACEDCSAFKVCPYHHDLEPIECFSKRTRHFI